MEEVHISVCFFRSESLVGVPILKKGKSSSDIGIALDNCRTEVLVSRKNNVCSRVS